MRIVSVRIQIKLTSSNPDREYRIVQDGVRWNIEQNGVLTGQLSHSINVAIGLATASALSDKHNGLNAVVCVQERDCPCKHVWP